MHCPAWITRNFKAVETGISQVQAVDFEVTVRADKKEGSEAKLNVVAAVIGGGVKGIKVEKQEATRRH